MHDDADTLVPMLARIYRKRTAGYSALGYIVAEGTRGLRFKAGPPDLILPEKARWITKGKRAIKLAFATLVHYNVVHEDRSLQLALDRRIEVRS